MSDQNVTTSENSAVETDTSATYTGDQMRCLICVYAILNVFSEIMQLLLKQSGYRADLLYTTIYKDKKFKECLKDYEHDSLHSLTVSREYFGLDISLIVRIFIRYPWLIGGSPTQGWVKKPALNDVEVADDVQRLRQWRNHFVHKVKGNTDVTDFESFFNDVEAICGRLDVYLKTNGDKSFRTKIHKLRNNVLNMETAKQVEKEYESIKRISEDCIIWRKGSDLHVYTSPTFQEFQQQFNNGRLVNAKVHMTLTFENCNNPEIAEKMEKQKEIINQKLQGLKIENIKLGCLEIQIIVSDLDYFKHGSLINVVTAVVEQLDTILEIQEWLKQQDVLVVSVNDEHILASEPSYSPVQVDLAFDRDSVKTTKFESLLKEMFQQITTELDEKESDSDLQVLASLQRKPEASFKERRDKLVHIYDCVEKLLNCDDYESIFEHVQINYYMKALSTMHPTLMRTFDIVLIGKDDDAKCALIRSLTGQEVVFQSTSAFSSGFIIRFIDSNRISIATRTRNDEITSTKEFKNLEDLRMFIDKTSDFSEDVNCLDVCYPFSSSNESNTIISVPDVMEITKRQDTLQRMLKNAVSVTVFIKWESEKHELSKSLDSYVQIRTQLKDAFILEAVFLSQSCSWYRDQNASHVFYYGEIEWERPLQRICGICPELPLKSIFKIPLHQTENGHVVQSKQEIFRFENMLSKIIKIHQNELIKNGCRIIQMYCQRLLEDAQAKIENLGHIQLDEKERLLRKNSLEIEKLRSFCNKEKEKMVKIKIAIVEELTEKLLKYLNTDTGRDEILNLKGEKDIGKYKSRHLSEEVKRRIENGIRDWCEKDETKEILKKANVEIQKFVDKINFKIDATTKELDSSMAVWNLLNVFIVVSVIIALLGPLFWLSPVSTFVLIFLGSIWGWYKSERAIRLRARNQYRKTISQIKASEFRYGFEHSFGKNFDNTMNKILDEEVPPKIKALEYLNEQLERECRILKKERATAILFKDEVGEISERLRQMHCTSSF